MLQVVVVGEVVASLASLFSACPGTQIVRAEWVYCILLPRIENQPSPSIFFEITELTELDEVSSMLEIFS